MRRALLAVFLLGLAVGMTAPAVASATVHWPMHNVSGDDNVEIDNDRLGPFDPNESANFKNRAIDAIQVWTDANPGVGFDFFFQDQRAMANSLTANNVTNDETWIMDYWINDECVANQVCWDWPTSGVCPSHASCYLGWTGYDISGSEIEAALVKINRDPNIPWFQGTGVPGAEKYDLFSVMVHEFGHATGATHINSIDCSHPGALTMCGYRHLHKGTDEQRSLEPHEVGDFNSAY